jgi:hypothetical protein
MNMFELYAKIKKGRIDFIKEKSFLLFPVTKYYDKKTFIEIFNINGFDVGNTFVRAKSKDKIFIGFYWPTENSIEDLEGNFHSLNNLTIQFILITPIDRFKP